MKEAPREGGKKPQWRPTARWFWRDGCFYLFWFIVLLGVVLLLIKPVAYQVTHFLATDCGELHTSDAPSPYVDQPNEAAGLQDIRCFVQAHQQCAAATLSISYIGIDRGEDVSFRTANGLGRCTLSETVNYTGGCVTGLCSFFPYIDSDCRAMQQEQDGLHFLDCGNVPDSVFQI